jgi:hypothetical protein
MLLGLYTLIFSAPFRLSCCPSNKCFFYCCPTVHPNYTHCSLSSRTHSTVDHHWIAVSLLLSRHIVRIPYGHLLEIWIDFKLTHSQHSIPSCFLQYVLVSYDWRRCLYFLGMSLLTLMSLICVHLYGPLAIVETLVHRSHVNGSRSFPKLGNIFLVSCTSDLISDLIDMRIPLVLFCYFAVCILFKTVQTSSASKKAPPWSSKVSLRTLCKWGVLILIPLTLPIWFVYLSFLAMIRLP